MYKNVRVETDSNNVQRYFLILYQGLKTKHFYWEFVNSSRKIAILVAFLLPTNLQIMFSLAVLISTWRLQSYLQPYKNNDNNKIEILGVNVGVITLCCGMIYNSADTNSSLNTCLLVIMLCLNLIFIIRWLYLLIGSLSEKYEFFKLLSNCISKYILFNRNSDEEIVAKKVKKKRRKLIKVVKGKRGKIGKQKTHRRRGIKNKKGFQDFDISEFNMVKSSQNRGKLSGSDQRMINNHSMDKYHEDKERKSRDISSRIIENNPDSDSSKLDHILHAYKNNKNSNKESQDQMVVDQEEAQANRKLTIVKNVHTKVDDRNTINERFGQLFKLKKQYDERRGAEEL